MPQPAKLKKPTETQAHAAILIRVAIELEAHGEALRRIEVHLEWLRAQVGKLAGRKLRHV
jgi:hypothetical protein